MPYYPQRLVNADGWQPVNEVWTFASSTTITVPTGAALRYQKGDCLKLNNTTTKYFYVVGVADTVLTVAAGSDYTVANAVISAIFVCHEPGGGIGFPGSFNWTPGYTGFSANPAATSAAKFWVVGNVCTVQYVYNGAGTSNATTFTITGLPISAAQAMPEFWVGFGSDNGAAANTVQGSLATTVLTLFKDQSNGVWTNTGAKGIYNFTFSYPF